MSLLPQITALIAILAVGIVYGTDAFCALVMRPALARVDDSVLAATMGNVHRYGDSRMPIPGAVGLVASAATIVLSAMAGHVASAATAGIALASLIVWMIVYVRISAPINRILTSAADAHETPANARALQASWDRVIVLRSVLQGLAIAALVIGVILS